MLLQARALVISNNEEARRSYEEYYNRKATAREFKPGDKCLVHFKDPKPGMNSKLYRPWKGIYRVTAVLDQGVLALMKMPEMKEVHIHMKRVKLFHEFDSPEDAEVDLGASERPQPRQHRKPSDIQEGRPRPDQQRTVDVPTANEFGQQGQQIPMGVLTQQPEQAGSDEAATDDGLNPALALLFNPTTATPTQTGPVPQLTNAPQDSNIVQSRSSLQRDSGTFDTMASDRFPLVAPRRTTRQGGVPAGNWVQTPNGLQFQRRS